MKIYPVVHVKSSKQALRLSHEAFDAGADGVFLIDHDPLNHYDHLTDVYADVRRGLGESAWIGVNYLPLSPAQAVWEIGRGLKGHVFDQAPDGLWADDAITTADLYDVPALKARTHLENLQYFGGIAFKYTSFYTDDPEISARMAEDYASKVDVVTTSGPGTGHSANVAKVAAMKAVIGEQPLALASGVSVRNIDNYRPYVDSILAASSIEKGKYSGEFDLKKLHDLVQAAHSN